MENLNLFYQVNIFGDFSHVDVSPENIYKIMTLFRDYNLVPNNFQEFNPTINPSPVVRPSFSSINGEWIIEIASSRLKIQQNSISATSINTSEILSFIEKTAQMIELFLSEFPVNSHRVSLASKTLFSSISEERLNDIYPMLTNAIPFYQESVPFEWNMRSVGRVNYELNGNPESINVISDISRVQGEMVQNNQVSEFDRIGIDFDINTLAENQTGRFNYSPIHEFLIASAKTRDEIMKQVELIIFDQR